MLEAWRAGSRFPFADNTKVRKCDIASLPAAACDSLVPAPCARMPTEGTGWGCTGHVPVRFGSGSIRDTFGLRSLRGATDAPDLCTIAFSGKQEQAHGATKYAGPGR